MTEHRLSILHVSDLHARSMEVDELPEAAREARRGQVRREAASRARVLGKAWTENLRALYPDGERPDLVCFTGDVADWGLASEYVKATELVDELVRVLGIERSLVYVVPGNHDVQRYVSQAEWAAMRELLWADPRAASDWLAGGKPPRAVEAGVADAVMQRTAAFWRWVEHGLGRPELLPAKHPHRRLGYHVAARPRGMPFDVHVVGLDSAWLAGDDHDQGKLWLTGHQRDMLLHDEHGRPWEGFRLALVHHPLEELAQPDIGPSRRGLARSADLLLHGHQHDAVGSSLVDPDGEALRVLAAGCLYEGTEGSEWKNGCQRIDVVLDERGRPQRAEIHFRAWSNRGHWYSDSSLYRGLRDGRMVWDAWGGADRSEPSMDGPRGERIEGDEPLATRLEDAYSRRDELAALGEDTSDIIAEILDLRRKQRQGPALHAGEFLEDGRFRLVKVIGHGGFATVWKAHDRSTNEPVAIKVLHGQFAHMASRRERLFRGAKRMAQLEHPNVVRVLVPEGEERGFYYYVMEYMAGGDLHQAVLHRRIGYSQAIDVVESIAGALEAAHAQGLVHRDVKPQNILLHEDGTPKLSDFDLVRAKDTTGGTRTGALGTVLYAAPEQNEDAQAVDHRADVYSLGMTAVFCIHGDKLPQAAIFKRKEFLDGLECSKDIREVLRRAVALNPGDRFESMASLRAALEDARHVRTGDAPVRGVGVSRRSLLFGGAAVGTAGLGYGIAASLLRDAGIENEKGESSESAMSLITPDGSKPTVSSDRKPSPADDNPPAIENDAVDADAVVDDGETEKKDDTTEDIDDRDGAPQPKHPSVGRPGSAAALLQDARVKQYTTPSIAYQLAKQSYRVKPSNDALWVMGITACYLKDKSKARWVLKRLKDASDKTKLQDICAQKGFEI